MAQERHGAAHRILTGKVQDPAGGFQPTIGGTSKTLPRYDAAPTVSTVSAPEDGASLDATVEP